MSTRKQVISLDTVVTKIEAGLGAGLSWDNVLFGHPKCHRIGYAAVLGKGDEVLDLFDDREVLAEMLDVFDDVYFDRTRPRRAVLQAVEAEIRRGWLIPGLRYLGWTGSPELAIAAARAVGCTS